MKTDPISVAKWYRQVFERILKVVTLQEARKLATEALEVTFSAPESDSISVTNGYGHATQQPFVSVAMTSPAVQLPLDQARQIALQILEAAEAAQGDGFVVNWIGSGPGNLDQQQVGTLLNDFRAYREQLRGKEPE